MTKTDTGSGARGQPLAGTPEPMHFWSGAEGLQLAGDAWGKPGDPLVLLLHGGGQHRGAWRDTGPRMAAVGYQVVAFDARGHGDSDWAPDGDYEPDAFVRDLVCLVAQLGGQRPALMGASLGGNAALAAVGQQRVDASALVLLDIVPRTERAGFDRVKGFMAQKPEGFASLDEVADVIASYRTDGRRPGNPAGLGRNVRLWPDGRYRWHWDPAFLDARERDFATRHDRLAECARRLRAPTLLVRGGSSDVVSEAAAQEFLALCPHAEYLNVAGAGHMLTADDNSVFSQATLDFLKRHAPGARTARPDR